MTKKKKIILISLAVTLALAVGVGGFVYAENNINHYHTDVGGNKLLGVGEMGYYEYDYNGWDQYQEWDTQFIITNPNCDRYLTIEWVALIDSEGAFGESVIYEGPPGGPIPGVLDPHQTFQVSIAELMGGDPEFIPLDKYTLEITWSGARYTGWWWWGYWRSGRPLTGWQKEKCWSYWDWESEFPGFAISEAPMELFPSRRPFKLPEIPNG